MHIGYNPLQLGRKDTFVLNILLVPYIIGNLNGTTLLYWNPHSLQISLLDLHKDFKTTFQINTKYFNEDPNINVL